MGRTMAVGALAPALLACGVAATPTAAAEPYNCPPACDSIPDAAWPAPMTIPLNNHYDWPQLPALAVTAPAERFRFEELCRTPAKAGDPRSYAVTERVTVVNNPGQWQLRAQVLHWRGETWRGGQLVNDAFDAAVDALRTCQRTNPEASPSVTLDEPGRMAAVISGPVILHQYLLANTANSTISELALWSTAPPLTPWPVTADAAVLDALAAPLCSAYLGSCP
jgi:hypothetical protein